MMGRIELDHLSKSFAGSPKPIVDNVSLTIEDGEFVVLLGPSGCGKTTLLRLIAGLDQPDAGDIRFDGESVRSKEPRDRDIALVFQQYALYPHLSVEKNLIYPLKVAPLSKQERQERVEWAADLVGITALLDRRPSELSGGEQQRVAVARAIVRRPRLFLMDEPLSNLDMQTRVKLRAELRALQQSIQTTTIMVTHDQADAMAIADRIVVIAKGVVQQFGSPDDLYERPANRFVASFLGNPSMNLFGGVVEGKSVVVDHHWRLPLPGHLSLPPDVIVGIRPESIELVDESTEGGLLARVKLIEPLGSEVIVHVTVGNLNIRVRCGPHTRPDIESEVVLSVDSDAIHLFDPVSGDALT